MTKMSDLDILGDMIKTTARVAVVPHYDRHKAVLTEPQCPESRVEIRNIPRNAVIIIADKFPQPDRVFYGKKGECKRADYIIVAEKGGRTVVVYVELKHSNNDTSKDIQNQLLGAQCGLYYCQAIGRAFWGKSDFLDDVVHRFVCFVRAGSVRKGRIREVRHAPVHDTPEEFMKLDWVASVEFNRIAGRV